MINTEKFNCECAESEALLNDQYNMGHLYYPHPSPTHKQGSGNIIEEEVRTMGPESLLCTRKESYARKALTMWSHEQVWMFNENAG